MRKINGFTLFMLLTLSLFLLMAQACGGDDDDNTTDGDVADGDDATDGDGTTDGDTDGLMVTIEYAGQQYEYNLNDFETTTIDEAAYVEVIDLWNETGIATALTDLEFKFYASDGFDPSTKSTCDGYVPVDGSNLDKAYIEQATRFLYWDEALEYPGCLHVKDMSRIEALDK